jgi:hypothetical protein
VNDAALFEKIKSGKYDDDDPVWDTISEGAKDLISRMLTVDVDKRLRATECLAHPWLQEQATALERAAAGGGDGAADAAKAPSEAKLRALATRSRQLGSVSRMLSVRSMQRCAVQNEAGKSPLSGESLGPEAASVAAGAHAGAGAGACAVGPTVVAAAAAAPLLPSLSTLPEWAEGRGGGEAGDVEDVASFL